MTRAHVTTKHNFTSPPKPSPETYKHFTSTPRLLQHAYLYAPQHCFMRPINQLTAPAYAVSAAATQGAYLDTVPVPPYLHLSNLDFICGG